ncbi:MAG: glycoside hydrolase family 5 protein [Reichenbachiella sp.]
MKLSIKKISMVLGLSLLFSGTVYGEGPVDVYGEMKVKGQYFVGSKGAYKNAIVQVKGLSFFWNNWGGEQYWTADQVNNMVDNFDAEVLRVPVTTSSKGKYADLGAAVQVIEQSIARGIYIIIDFHSHHAWNEVDEAKNFFTQAVEWYGQYDNVIFEIFNEPITNEPHDWMPVKNYADELVKHIRDLGSDNLIIVGTPCYDQVFAGIKENPVVDPDNNTAYAMHFYSYSHHVGDGWLGKNFKSALEDGLPFMVTEWGTSHFDGGQDGGSFDGQSADEWHALLDEYGFSSAMWSIFSHGQSSALWGNNGQAEGYIKGLLSGWKNEADWRTGNVRTIPGGLAVTGKDVSVALPESAKIKAVVEGGKEPYIIAWSKKSGGSATIADKSARTTNVGGLEVGSYEFIVSVTDGWGDVVEAVITVSVTGDDEGPVDIVSSEDVMSSVVDDISSSDAVKDISSDDIEDSSGDKSPPPDSNDIAPLYSNGINASQSLLYRVTNKSTLEITVSEIGSYSVTLFDVMGNLVSKIEMGTVSKGSYELQLSPSVREGLYVVQTNRLF